jgi:hypothetical protein
VGGQNGPAYLLFGVASAPHRTSTPKKTQCRYIHRPDWGQKKMVVVPCHDMLGEKDNDGTALSSGDSVVFAWRLAALVVVVVFCCCCWFITPHLSLVWMI